MFAVIKTGGKQYRVGEGDVLRVESLPVAEGDTVEFDQVLMIDDGGRLEVGTPFVEGRLVTATVRRHGRYPKIRVIKFRRRKHYMRRLGHRQNFTEVQVTGLSAGPIHCEASDSGTQEIGR